MRKKQLLHIKITTNGNQNLVIPLVVSFLRTPSGEITSTGESAQSRQNGCSISAVTVRNLTFMLHIAFSYAIIDKTKKVGDFMSEFTYETKDITRKLETLEWDNVWWEQTANVTAKRILYIGDSISCGTRRLITSLANSQILCDGFGTSKALDNPYFKPSLELFMKQQNKCDAILFNNGLHGWHLSDEEYEKYYNEMLLFLLQKGIPLYVVLTTDDIKQEHRGEFVKTRNTIAKALADKYNLPVIDLYTVATSNAQYHKADGVHFEPEGYELLAKCILENLQIL